MKILITGARGFVGSHLITILKKDNQLFAAGRQTVDKSTPDLQYIKLDVTNSDSITTALEKCQPDAIIHLAAQSNVGLAWQHPKQTLETNILGTTNLINAMHQVVPQSKLITIGSSEEYGLTGKLGVKLTEEQPCLPQNPYATSKLAVSQLAMQLAKKYCLNISHVRPFNHFGPGQRQGYVVSDFAFQIAKIEQGLCPPVLKVGDLTAQRDFTDVRDVVAAYQLLLQNNITPGIYNVCSGEAHSPKEILDIFLANSTVAIKVEQDPARLRPSEVPYFVGSAAKLNQLTGWEPTRKFKDSLIETLNWWRAKIAAEVNN